MSAAVARAAPTTARVWWMAARPATLAASVAPVLAGTAIAVHDGHVRALAGGAALLLAVAMQIGVNYANDYSDFVRGADSPRRVGPLRAAASGVIPPGQVRLAAMAAFGFAAIVGLALSLTTDWRLIPVGALCLLAGWLYTGGPRPYGYLGLGELFVFVFFGLVATVGTVYVEELRVTPLAICAGASLGFLASAILVLNNLRDIDTDRAAGKRTLATVIGSKHTKTLLVILVVAAFAIPILTLVFHLAAPTIMLVHFAILLAAPAVRAAYEATDPSRLVWALKRMALVEVAFALLMTAGLLV
jgi:1,4-dihydroxy-2-naphthoate polyprenyltransferase